MNAQLDMFGAEPSTDDSLVGLAVRRQFRARHKRRSKPTACRHEPNVVRRAGEIAMTEFVIVVTGRNGSRTELCRVRSNPEAVAEGARRKRIRVGKRTTKQYLDVQIVELEPQS